MQFILKKCFCRFYAVYLKDMFVLSLCNLFERYVCVKFMQFIWKKCLCRVYAVYLKEMFVLSLCSLFERNVCIKYK